MSGEVGPDDNPVLRATLAGRRDPRYPAVREIIADFEWPDGRKMVPESYADILATRVMAVIVGQSTPRDDHQPANEEGQ